MAPTAADDRIARVHGAQCVSYDRACMPALRSSSSGWEISSKVARASEDSKFFDRVIRSLARLFRATLSSITFSAGALKF